MTDARRKTGGIIGRGIAAVLVVLPLLSTGCSIQKFAVNKLGDALSDSGSTYASDDDPQLVADALPFSLKLMESLLEQSPEHTGLLMACASGFTQYAYAFVQQEADEQEADDLRAAIAGRRRAGRLYLRARDYGLRGLEVAHPGITATLHTDAATAVAELGPDDAPLIYWTGAAWGAAISVGKDQPLLIADLPAVEALLRRGLELQEEFDAGAFHGLLLTLEAAGAGGRAGAEERARGHFQRVVELSGGQLASPYLSLAESISVRNQDRAEFVSLLEQALQVDPDARPEWRLLNLIMQRRARWLLGRQEMLFVE